MRESISGGRRMAGIPDYQTWMKQTAAFGRARSPFLKLLDEAVKGGDKDKIKVALDRWRFEQSKEGKDWRTSVRNQSLAVTNLYRAVNTIPRAPSKEERDAMAFLAAEQAKALMKTFANTKLVFKSDTLAGAISGNATRMQKLSQAKQVLSSAKGHVQTGAEFVTAVSGGGVGNPFEMVKAKLTEAINNLCPPGTPGLDPDSVMRHIGLPGLADFMKEAVPILGAIRSGAKVVQAWAEVARTAKEKYKAAQARNVIAKGDPEAALKAIHVILNRELASGTATATSATLSFSMQVAGMVGDMGTVSGPAVAAVQAIAEILQAIYEFVRDWKELNRANELLRLGALNLELFETCPLLGCYFLALQDHSTIIAFAITDYGTANWQFDVEKMVKTLQPVLETARRMVKASKFELMGVVLDSRTMDYKLTSLQQSKGLVEANYSTLTGMDKALAFPGHVKEVLTEKFMKAIGRGQAA
jgi:hypothetical protein